MGHSRSPGESQAAQHPLPPCPKAPIALEVPTGIGARAVRGRTSPPHSPNLRLKLFKGHQAHLTLFSFFSEGAGGGVATNMNNGTTGLFLHPGLL